MNSRLAALVVKPRPRPTRAPKLATVRARLNNPRAFEYVLIGCSLIVYGALIDINDAAVGLGWVSP
jgi:hypothetical protein